MPDPASTQHPRLAFRPDIEGIRAIAILAVVACHAGIPGFNGGFSGVDMFFVLSGFLITGLLLKEIAGTGSISLLDFYARRLKRLLPSLLLVSVFTLLLASILLPPLEQIEQARSIVAVPLWISNFHFSIAELDYFASENDSNLFLHTWSLAVEEQFYLLWPLLLLSLAGIMRRPPAAGQTGDNHLDTGPCLRVLTVLVLASFTLGLWLSYVKPLWGFYMMPSRAWQFGLGGLVFMLSDRHRLPDAGTALSRSVPLPSTPVMAWFGLALLACGTLLLSESMHYPGFGALLPSLGTALLLFCGRRAADSTPIRLLSVAPMQTLGRLSYAWYLWHWPLLVLARELSQRNDPWINSGASLLALLLAAVSQVCLEAPVRHSMLLNRHPRLTMALGLLLMTGTLGLGLYWNEQAKRWAQEPEQIAYARLRQDLPRIYSMGCDDWYSSPGLRICRFGPVDAEHRAVLFGDSIAAQWFTALARPLVEQGWQFLVLTKSACPIVDEPIFYARIGTEYTVCEAWRNAALDYLAEFRPERLYMGSASTYDYSRAQWLAGTTRILERLAPATRELLIVLGSYRLPFDGPNCLAGLEWRGALLKDLLPDCVGMGPTERDLRVAEALGRAADGYPRVAVLNLNPLICPERRCPARLGDMPVFRDAQHLSNRFVEMKTAQIQLAVERVLDKGDDDGSASAAGARRSATPEE